MSIKKLIITWAVISFGVFAQAENAQFCLKFQIKKESSKAVAQKLKCQIYQYLTYEDPTAIFTCETEELNPQYVTFTYVPTVGYDYEKELAFAIYDFSDYTLKSMLGIPGYLTHKSRLKIYFSEESPILGGIFYVLRTKKEIYKLNIYNLGYKSLSQKCN